MQESIINCLKEQVGQFIALSPNHIKLNLMTLGEPSSGKDTFIDALFDCKVYDLDKKDYTFSSDSKLEERVKNCTLETEDGSLQVELTITKLKGFGAMLNNDESVVLPAVLLEERRKKYLE